MTINDSGTAPRQRHPNRIQARPRLLDNLIPLRGDTFGPQLAGWTPGPPVSSGLGCLVWADQMIPVGAGISLAADVYTPRTPGRYPAVVTFAGYSKELQSSGAPTATDETGSPPVFTDRGYVHIIATRRGMGRSQGESVIFFNDQDVDDHAKIIEWAAAQPWCDGNVVTFGTSYYGITQPLVATRQPPALRGFFTIEMCTDYFRQIVMFGGTPQLYFLNLWMGGNFTDAQKKLRVPPVGRALGSQIFNNPSLKKLWWPQMQKRLVKIQNSFLGKAPARAFNELFASWVIDGKTRETNSIPAGPYQQMDKIAVPFVVVQNPGHLNLHQFGAYDLFQNAATPKDRKWLIIGPAEYDLPCMHWQLEALAFFDHLLHGADNGYARQPAVRYYTDGTSDYRTAADFPIPGSQTVRLHPAGGGASDAMHPLTPDPEQATGTGSWAAVPIGAPVTAGFDEVTNQIVSYQMGLGEDTEFCGPVTANLRFSCNEIDSYVIARLGRVDAAGVYHLLSLGTISPARRRIDDARSTATEVAIDISNPEPLIPGQPVTLRFSLTPHPVVAKKGEWLRLDVGSRTDLLRSDVSHGHAQFDMQVPPYFSRNTLHHGPETYIELRKVPAADPARNG
jgi:putative CocE/NonD family hydrolase